MHIINELSFNTKIDIETVLKMSETFNEETNENKNKWM